MTDEPRPTALHVLCDEPYRVLFPLGLLCGLIGVSHWVWYHAGLIETYSGLFHGLLQIQGFQTAFAAGFLMTALPRFMEVPGARPWELAAASGLVAWSAVELCLDDRVLAQVGFLALMVHLSVFALRRFRSREDTPPPEFIFIPIGIAHGLAGGLLILWPLAEYVKLGSRMLEQGMILAFIMAIGPFLGARLLGLAPSAAGFARSAGMLAALYVLAGVLLMLSFWIEAGYSETYGRLLRAVVVSVHLLRTVRVYRRPSRPLWHLRFLWLSFWCVMGGLLLSAVFPDYEFATLHITFIGGLGLMTLMIASRVIAAHCGFEPLWARNARVFRVVGVAFVAALATRVAADLYPDYYFGFLHIGAGFWLLGALAWGFVFVPKLAPWNVSEDDDE